MAQALADRSAIITGGARGLGLEIARAFVAAGARVLVTGRDEQALEAARRELGVTAVRADVADPQACAQVVARAGEVTALVNNAALTGPIGPLESNDWEPGWDKLMRFTRELTLTHPYPVRRVHELMVWVRSGEYDRIIAGEYPRRGTRADARKEAGEAADYYGEKFKGIFKEAGVGASKAGDKAGEAAEKLSDWIKTR